MAYRHTVAAGFALGLVACSAFSSTTPTDVGADAARDAATGAGVDAATPLGDAGEGGAATFCSAYPQAALCDDFSSFDPGVWTQTGNGLETDELRYVSAPSSLAMTTKTPSPNGGAQATRTVAMGTKLVRCSFSLSVGDLTGIGLFDVAALVVRSAGQRYSVRLRISGNPKRLRLMTVRDGDTNGVQSVDDVAAPGVGEWIRVEVVLDPGKSLATLTSGGASASVAQSQIAIADATEIVLGGYALSGQDDVTVAAWYDDVVCAVE